VLCTMPDVEKPVPIVIATNNDPIGVAAGVPAIIKKLSQPWSIVKQCSPSAAFVHYELREPEVVGLSAVLPSANALDTDQPGCW
jgi:hypothetical protein